MPIVSPWWRPWAAALCLLLLGISLSPARAQVPTWQWATSPGMGSVAGTATDAAGNVYVAGHFTGTATFGATTLTSAGQQDLFVARRSPAGVWQWAVRAGGTANDFAQALAVDPAGNVVVAGGFSNTVAFGATTLNSQGGYDVVVARLDSAGAWQWAASAGGFAYEYATDLALDPRGNVYVGGWFFSPSLIFGTFTVANSRTPFTDLYVARLSATGQWQWAVGAGGDDNDSAWGLAADYRGNVYVTGAFVSPSVVFGSATTLFNNSPAAASQEDVFVAQLDSLGFWQWAAAAGGTGSEQGQDIAVDANADVYVTGDLSGTARFGNTTLVSTAPFVPDLWVAKLSGAGQWQWATQATGAGAEHARGIGVDARGDAYVTGDFESNVLTFGAAGAVPNSGPNASDLLVAKISRAGAWSWALSAGGLGSEQGQRLALDPSGNLYVAGRFTSATVAFGPDTVSNPTGGTPNATFAMFVSRLNAAPLAVAPEAAESAFRLAPNPAHGTVGLSGAPAATADLLDATGRVVRTVALRPSTPTLDLRGLPTGLYLVRCGGQARRLVVE